MWITRIVSHAGATEGRARVPQCSMSQIGLRTVLSLLIAAAENDKSPGTEARATEDLANARHLCGTCDRIFLKALGHVNTAGYSMGGLGGRWSPTQIFRIVRSSYPISEAKPRRGPEYRGLS